MDLHVLVSDELVARVDAVRGDASRSLWIRRAVEQALGSADAAPGQPGGARPSPAPAEQPMTAEEAYHEGWRDARGEPEFDEQPERVPEAYHETVARNVPVPREFRPYPKGGK